MTAQSPFKPKERRGNFEGRRQSAVLDPWSYPASGPSQFSPHQSRPHCPGDRRRRIFLGAIGARTLHPPNTFPVALSDVGQRTTASARLAFQRRSGSLAGVLSRRKQDKSDSDRRYGAAGAGDQAFTADQRQPARGCHRHQLHPETSTARSLADVGVRLCRSDRDSGKAQATRPTIRRLANDGVGADYFVPRHASLLPSGRSRRGSARLFVPDSDKAPQNKACLAPRRDPFPHSPRAARSLEVPSRHVGPFQDVAAKNHAIEEQAQSSRRERWVRRFHCIRQRRESHACAGRYRGAETGAARSRSLAPFRSRSAGRRLGSRRRTSSLCGALWARHVDGRVGGRPAHDQSDARNVARPCRPARKDRR